MKFKPKKNKFGFIEAIPKPSQNFLDNFYKKTYFNKKVTKSFSDKYSKNELLNKSIKAKFDINFAKKKLRKKRVNFLEIGSGEGFILKQAVKEKKWNVVGIDFNKFGIKKFNKKILKYFIETNPDEFLKNEIKKKTKFDLIVLNNVLEHVINPNSLLKNINKLVNKSSVILITIPNDFSFLQLAALKQKKNFSFPWFQPPQHLSYFNTENINFFLKKNNFKVIDKISNFPIEFYLFSKFSFYYNNSSKGKEVHKARIFLENFIYKQGFDKAYKFFNSCCNIGMGRNFTILIKKIKI